MADDKGKKLVDLLYGQPTGSIRPTEVRNPAALGLGQALQKGHEFVSKPFGYPNPPAEAISEFLGVPAIARTLERLGYGEPLTTGRGMTTKPKEDTVEALLSVAPMVPATKGMPVGAVIRHKKDANWLTGSVEKSLAPLKSTTIAGETPAQRIPKHEQLLQDPSLSAESRAAVERHLNEEKQRAAIDNWVDRNLANYVKKEMATPEDPVRKLAEQGILHIDPQVPRIDEMNAQLHRGTFRQSYGEDAASVMGQSELARKWEDLTDAAVDPHMAGMLRAYESENVLGANPWIQKLPEKELVSSLKRENVEGLGFDHIIDVLREDLATGRIRPEQLNKVSMEQAVRRTYEYDQAMAKKMREAQIKATEGMPVYKEYPEGYKWIELAPPKITAESLPAGYEMRQLPNKSGGTYYSLRDMNDRGLEVGAGTTPELAIKNAGKRINDPRLEEALKYEGETMGHCVGGYCPDVEAGRSRIFSLRDAKGEPHVTIEVEPAPRIGFREGEGPKTPEERFDLQTEWLKGVESGKIGGDVTFANWWRQKNNIPEPELPFQISQIKGKQNRAPKEEYLPFVQDFVRGGQWSRIGDFQNTGLIRKYDLIDKFTPEELDAVGVGEYLTKPEYDDLLLKALRPAEGQAHGGRVHISNNPDTMRMELAGGGALSKVAMEALSKVKLLREEMAAKAALQAQYAKEMEGVYTKDMPTFEQWKATQEQQKAEGGGVDRVTTQDMLYLMSQPDLAKMSPQQQREALANMGDTELRQRMAGKMADGGGVRMEDGGAAFGAYTTGKKYQQARQRAQESGAAEVVEGALRGILGLDPQEDAGSRGMEAYRNAQVASSSPTPLALAALPAGVIKRAKSSEALVNKFVYPQESALERARQNAVKLLGLPENNTPEMRAKAMGYMDYLHGTERLDRLLEGKTLDPRRATSGPMPYGTTTPELASSYATSKADTSRRATDEGDVRKYFEVAPKDIGVKGMRSPIPVERAWYFMSPEQKAKIQNLAPRVGYENLDEFTGNFIVHPEGVNATLSPNQWDWFMKNKAKGNPLTALREMWYSSGQLVDEPERLAEIYRLAGIDAPISQTKAPWTEAQGVLLGKARITNPIDTSNTEQVSALIEPLKQAFAKDRSKTKVGGPDQWAKESRYTPKTWVAELEKDLSEGKESYVWTSIPDKVTAELKKLGFNGIIDRSGKGGGAKEPVVIPFDPSQVRSRFAAFDPAEMEAADLLKAYGGAIKKAPGGEVTIPDMTDGGKVIDGGPFKKGGKVQFTDNLDTMRLAVGRK